MEGLTRLSGHDHPPDESFDEGFAVAVMEKWERWTSIILGVILSSLGVWAVFASSNQVGSAVLILLGGAFLLIGVQGTPLIKVGGSVGNLELERRRRDRARKAIDQARAETNPEVAQGMIEAAAIIEPELALAPRTQEFFYETRVGSALRKIFKEVRTQMSSEDVDFAIVTPMGRTAVDVKYKRFGEFRIRDVASMAHRYQGKDGKTVVVTNVPLSEEVRAINAAGNWNGIPVEVVTWNDPVHDGILQRAILRRG